MIIFQYCGGVYNIFRTFSGLNKRLNSILVDRRLHLFTDFLCMHHSNTNLDYYYNSALFHDVSQQLLSLTKTENDKKLRQCFQSLVFFHIKVHANQLKHEFQSNMKHFQSIRLLLTNEETQYVDEELKNSLNKLKICPKSVKNIEKIISLVLKQGARLQYDDNESHEFNLTKSINELLLSKLNSIECCTRQLINALVQMFKSLIISNPSFLKDHDWFYYDSYDILNMLNFTNVVTNHEIFIEASQIGILNIVLNEYSFEDKILLDEDFNDAFQRILDNLIENNRIQILLCIYHTNERITNLFQKSWNNQKYVNIMTRNRTTRQFFHALLNDYLLRTWLISTDLLFILLQKRECKLVKKLLKLSPSLVHQCDNDGNDPLLYVCLNVYKQKVKHLLYEQQNNIAELKAETIAELKVAQEGHNEAENSMWKEKRELKVQMKDQELAQQEVVRNLKKTNETYVSKLRDDFLRQAREIEEKYEKKLRDLREEMELRRKTEIHEIEERKNQQINDLLRNHEKAFSDIKNYYNDITLNNLNLINTLKNEIEKKKQEEERLEKRMSELENENRKMREPLEAARKETEELRRRAENYEKIKSLYEV
ncbi:unnamed protein product [Rotaria sp. Silwood1]|nr:unnamed protein product [Rotaria sp. Silwood1]